MTLYETLSGARVFATGTIQWSWGLDDYNAPSLRTARSSEAAQQMTHRYFEVSCRNHAAIRPIRMPNTSGIGGVDRLQVSMSGRFFFMTDSDEDPYRIESSVCELLSHCICS